MIDNEANVIIASPDLLIDLLDSQKIDLSATNILVVDDINLIKKRKQLANLEKILEILPADKQNIVYTNRRSRETQDILDKILKAPQEIKVDKAKEQEAQQAAPAATVSKPAEAKTPAPSKATASKKIPQPAADKEALDLIKKFNSFGGKTPAFITVPGILARDEK